MRFKFFPAISLVASLFFISCNGDDKKTTDTTVSTDTTSTAVTPEPIEKPGLLLITKAKVASFDKWKAAFDSRESERQANGLRAYIVARGSKDTTMIMVAYKIEDPAKVKAYRASKEFRDNRKAAGVMGEPTDLYVDVQMLDTSPGASSDRVIVTTKVKDWDAWKNSFDGHKQARVDAGLVDRAVGFSIGDSNNVTVALAMTDVAKGEAFMASKDLKDKMAESGVVGKPDIFFYHVVQTY